MGKARWDRCCDCGAVYTDGYRYKRCPICQRKYESMASSRAHAKARYGSDAEATICPMCGRNTWRSSGFCAGCEKKLYRQNRMVESYMGARVSYV